MNNSTELQHLAGAIGDLVAAIAEIIEMKAHAVLLDFGPTHPPGTVRAPGKDYWLTKRQLASHFNVSTRTIENWKRRGYFRRLAATIEANNPPQPTATAPSVLTWP